MLGEVEFFLDKCLLDLDFVNDVFLTSVLYSHITKSKFDMFIHNHFLSVGSSVHNIDLAILIINLFYYLSDYT